MRNHEAQLAAQRRWYQKNRDKVLAWQKDYVARDPERHLARGRAYNARPEVKERARRRYLANREAVRAYQMAYDRSLEGRFKSGRKGARERDISWDLTFGKYVGIIAVNCCHYCEGSLSPTGCGLDRIDNAKGYEVGNVLPCCGDCNAHRQNTWTVVETRAAVQAVLHLRKVKCNA